MFVFSSGWTRGYCTAWSTDGTMRNVGRLVRMMIKRWWCTVFDRLWKRMKKNSPKKNSRTSKTRLADKTREPAHPKWGGGIVFGGKKNHRETLVKSTWNLVHNRREAKRNKPVRNESISEQRKMIMTKVEKKN